MSRSELLHLSFGGLFHPFTDFVDIAPRHVVELAVVPNKLDVIKGFFVGRILARQ